MALVWAFGAIAFVLLLAHFLTWLSKPYEKCDACNAPLDLRGHCRECQ